MATIDQTSPLGKVLWPVLAWTIALIFFFPIFWMVFTSFKTDADAVKPEFLFSFTPTLENYLNMTENYDYWRFAINSVITSVFATTLALIVGIPAAYAMAFNPSRHTKDILVWMLSTKMLPAAAVLYPMTFLTKNFLGIFDTLSKLIEGNRAPEGLFFGRLSAVSTAAVGPIVVLGWFCQKQLVRGLTFGAVK